MMRLEKNSALLVIDIQQEDFAEMNESNQNEPRWNCIRNARRVLDVFRSRRGWIDPGVLRADRDYRSARIYFVLKL